MPLEQTAEKLAKAKRDLAGYEQRDPNRVFYGSQIEGTKKLIKGYEDQIAKIKEVEDTERKLAEMRKANRAAEAEKFGQDYAEKSDYRNKDDGEER